MVCLGSRAWCGRLRPHSLPTPFAVKGRRRGHHHAVPNWVCRGGGHSYHDLPDHPRPPRETTRLEGTAASGGAPPTDSCCERSPGGFQHATCSAWMHHSSTRGGRCYRFPDHLARQVHRHRDSGNSSGKNIVLIFEKTARGTCAFEVPLTTPGRQPRHLTDRNSRISATRRA